MGKLIEIAEKRKKISIVNQDISSVEMTFYGPVGGYFDDAIRLSDVANALDGLPETINEIVLRVNSPGGDVFEGVAIYNRLKQHDARIVAYVDAMAASIASIIIMAADEVIMGEGSEIMVHHAMTFSYGNSNDFQNVIDRLDQVDENLISIYQNRTGLDRVEIARLMDAETYMNADKAIKLGFASRSAREDENGQRYAACFDLDQMPWIKKSPTRNLQKPEHQNKIKSLVKDIEGFLAR